jgi:chemotaxis methyl-accepting protein methylase
VALHPANVRAAIERNLGLELQDPRLELLTKWLYHRSASLRTSPAELLAGLFGPDLQQELSTALALITNQETSFFRGEKQLDLLDEAVLHPLLSGDVSRPIRLWSGASSTGEEALTLGMLVNDRVGRGAIAGVDHPPVGIVATDICRQTVSTARAMRYSLLSETRLGPIRSDRYFTLDGSALVADKVAFPPISYHVHNLINPSSFGQFDVVLVRNVFFYLSKRATELVLRNVWAALRPAGVMVIGVNDGIEVPRGFEPIGVHCYRRIELR